MTKYLTIQQELQMIKDKTHFNLQDTVEPMIYTYSAESYLNVCLQKHMSDVFYW